MQTAQHLYEGIDVEGQTVGLITYMRTDSFNVSKLLQEQTKKFIGQKYGEQFVVESYEICMPEEKDSIVEFLSSGLFKGIGEAKAQLIIDYRNTKGVFNDINDIKNVSGIGDSLFDKIKDLITV